MKKLIALINLFCISITLSVSAYSIGYQQQGDYINNVPMVNQCVNLRNNLSYRSTDFENNYEVSKLQDFLNEKNFLNTEPTGFFGRATEYAVKNYQASKGLANTGYVGPLTRSAISQDSCNSTSNGGGNGGGVMCTMEMRICSDGSNMPRDPDCTWRVDRCPVVSTNLIQTCPRYRADTANFVTIELSNGVSSYSSNSPNYRYDFGNNGGRYRGDSGVDWAWIDRNCGFTPFDPNFDDKRYTCNGMQSYRGASCNLQSNIPYCDTTGTIQCFVAQQCRTSNGSVSYGCPAPIPASNQYQNSYYTNWNTGIGNWFTGYSSY